MDYIPPSRCESCVPTVTRADDGDTAELAHEAACQHSYKTNESEN